MNPAVFMRRVDLQSSNREDIQGSTMNTRSRANGIDDTTGGPELAARRDALESLRGPKGGYARSHRGLAAFWQTIAEEILVRPAPPEILPLLAQLDDWLAGGPAAPWW